ncbi:MAG: phospho-sugar mutase [Microbacteriaceae bacterium]|nr:phospho-sugar mutase [Microbacteriaceae bacterium]
MSIIDVARAWHAQDPDDETRAELDRLIADAESGSEGALAQLHDRFDARLEFGTAGLRGRIEAGSNRMNRVLVAQAAAGFASFLLSRGSAPSVVVGYDGRKNSKIFATDTAELMAGAGVRAILLPRLLPTPVLAFAVRELATSAGVMVTASHNPPQDNGYKVYLGDTDEGSQIVPPLDAEIAAHILAVATDQNVLRLPRSTAYEVADERAIDEYVRCTAALAGHPKCTVRYVYTALHGVGWETAHRVFLEAGFGEPIVVAAQIAPDAAFPTVAFPNPEEPGAMDLAFDAAITADAELVIANDPDADRLAIGIPDIDGEWQRLSGNQVGALLGWRAAERLAAAGTAGTLAASIVSSPALAEIARQYGLAYVNTLTGFKWVSRVPGLSYGYEEALGYLVDPDKVRDKDGISAAIEFLGLVADLKAIGRTVTDHLTDFAERFGAFASSQVSIRVTKAADIPRLMSALRQSPPERIAGVAVRAVDDFAEGFAGLSASDILRYQLEDGSRVIVRPSGTEPKVKVYIDASSVEGTAAHRQATAQATVDRLEAAMRELLAERA